MKRKLLFFISVVVGVMIIIAPLSPAVAWDEPKVRVMTRNLYLGADIFKVLEAAQNPDPALGGLDVPIAVAELFQTVQYTNFPERAEALANEIWFFRPHLIGLQEVSTWYIQSPSDFFDPFPPYVNPEQQPADVVVYDFLQILLDALAARGLNYEVAVSTEDNPLGGNADVELPMLTGFTTIPEIPDPVPTFDDVRLVDRDVILVRGDVETSSPATASYTTNVSESIGGVTLEFTRGWVAVDADVDGEVYRFVNTHLEVGSSPYSIFRVVQSAQMLELLTILSYESKQIIMTGDFNSSPKDVPGVGYYPECLKKNDKPLPECKEDGIPYVPPYMLAMDNFGYLDAWNLLLFPSDGLTSGFNETLDDPDIKQLTERIDLILLSQTKDVKSVSGIRTGFLPFSMTSSGLWPSDHAGVVVNIRFED